MTNPEKVPKNRRAYFIDVIDEPFVPYNFPSKIPNAMRDGSQTAFSLPSLSYLPKEERPEPRYPEYLSYRKVIR